MRSALVRIAALGVAGLYLALLILTWMANASVPDWGIVRGARWLEGPGRLVIFELAADGPAARAGLLPLDEIVSVNGNALSDEFFGKWAQERRVGDQVQLRVLRGENAPGNEQGSFQQVTLQLEPRFFMPIFLLTIGIYTVIGFLAVSVSLLVLLSRPEDWAARLLALGMGAYSFALLIDNWAYQFEQLWLTQLFLYFFVFGSAALLHLFMIFPVSVPFIRRLKEWGPRPLRGFTAIPVLYGLPLGLAVVLSQASNVQVVPTMFLGFALLACAALALIRGYGRVESSFEQAQLKWITLGLVAGILGTGVIILSLFNLRFEVVSLTIAASLWVLFPISVGIAVLRYRLYDIDLVINRTLVYLPLTGILAGLFAASITLSQRLSVALTGQQSDAATILTTLVVVAAFTPIKDRLQAIVDLRYKEAPQAATLLNAFAENLQARVMLVQPRHIICRLLEEAVAALEAKSGAAYLQSDGRLNLVDTLGTWDGNARLTVPLCAGGKEYGVVALGDRKRGPDYTAHEREVLQQTAQAVALAIEQDA